MSLSFNISETKHVIKKLTSNITVTSKLVIDKSKRKYIASRQFSNTFINSTYKYLSRAIKFSPRKN